MQVSFYNLCATPISQAIPQLLQKALDAGYRPSVCVPQGQDQHYAHMLWHAHGDMFLAHDSHNTAPIHLVDTPVYTRSRRFFVENMSESCLNGADAVYYVFDSTNPQVVDNARALWCVLRDSAISYQMQYYQQDENGRWNKK